MYRPTYDWACFTTVTVEEKVQLLQAMLDALVVANVFYLRGV